MDNVDYLAEAADRIVEWHPLSVFEEVVSMGDCTLEVRRGDKTIVLIRIPRGAVTGVRAYMRDLPA